MEIGKLKFPNPRVHLTVLPPNRQVPSPDGESVVAESRFCHDALVKQSIKPSFQKTFSIAFLKQPKWSFG